MHGNRKYKIKNIVGEGATGVVYKATTSEGKDVAVKIVNIREKEDDNTLMTSFKKKISFDDLAISKENVANRKNRNMIQYDRRMMFKSVNKEIKVLKMLNHENIVSFIDCYEFNLNYFIVTELCDYSLISFINEYNVDENIAMKILRMILCGLDHIHSMGIIHRDIKLSNLLIKGNCIKICDFGLSCFVYENKNTFCGTEDYIAPEMVERKTYNQSIDIYSVGKVFYTLLTKKKYNGVIDSNISSFSKDILLKMLEEDPKKRICSSDALMHPIFNMFLPVFYDFRVLRDFYVEERFGIIKKSGNTASFDNVDVEFIDEFKKNTNCCNSLNLKNLCLRNYTRTINRSETIFQVHSCPCNKQIRMKLKIANKEACLYSFTNSELKRINFGFAYLKLKIERLPVIVIENHKYKFIYMLSNSYVYNYGNYTIKKKKDVIEAFVDKNKVHVNEVPSYLDKRLFTLESECKKIVECLKMNSNQLVVKPIILNAIEDFYNHKSQRFMSSFISNSTSISPSFTEMNIFKKNYVFEQDLGWCIKNRSNFLFLFNNGMSFEILAPSKQVVFKERTFFINKNLPISVKKELKRILPLLKSYRKTFY